MSLGNPLSGTIITSDCEHMDVASWRAQEQHANCGLVLPSAILRCMLAQASSLAIGSIASSQSLWLMCRPS